MDTEAKIRYIKKAIAAAKTMHPGTALYFYRSAIAMLEQVKYDTTPDEWSALFIAAEHAAEENGLS